MKISPKGIAVIKHFERFYPNPYLCPAGVPTIGYGTTVYENGKKVSLRDQKITEPEGCELLLHDCGTLEHDVMCLVKVPITVEQNDALISFAYNVGPDIDADSIAEGLGDSTLLKLINSNIMKTNPDWKRIITNEFLKWNKATVNGKRTVLKGLTARRRSEAYLFCESIVKLFAA